MDADIYSRRHIGGRPADCFNHMTMAPWTKAQALGTVGCGVGEAGAVLLTESGQQVGEHRPDWPNKSRATMYLATMRIAAAALGAALLISAALAQGSDPKAGKGPQPTDTDVRKDGQRKLDEFADAAKRLGGPAAHPECVWLGRRVVGLMWRDDLDTAFRHLDLYDRFGCPAGHIQATFRCLVRQGNIDPKGSDTLAGRVHTCWINPNLEANPATAATPSAAPPSGTPR